MEDQWLAHSSGRKKERWSDTIIFTVAADHSTSDGFVSCYKYILIAAQRCGNAWVSVAVCYCLCVCMSVRLCVIFDNV